MRRIVDSVIKGKLFAAFASFNLICAWIFVIFFESKLRLMFVKYKDITFSNLRAINHFLPGSVYLSQKKEKWLTATDIDLFDVFNRKRKSLWFTILLNTSISFNAYGKYLQMHIFLGWANNSAYVVHKIDYHNWKQSFNSMLH